MTPFLGLLLILLITFIGVRFFSRSTILKTPLFSGLIVSGVPYILIGVFLGPKVFNFLNDKILDSLQPLIHMAIGWVGLLFGLQLRWRNIRRFPRNYVLFTSLQSLVTFFVISLAMGILIFFLSPPPFENRLTALIILAALGSMTAPLSIGRTVIQERIKGRLAQFLQFISSLDSFWGIVITGITFAIIHKPATHWLTSGWQWLILSVLTGIFTGLVFRYLLRLRFEGEEIFLLVLGLVIFISGIGFYLRLSPVFMNMVAGITIAQFPRLSEKFMRIIHSAEKPVYVLLLVFAGAFWDYRFWEEVLLIVSFIFIRYLGKYLGGWIGSRKIDCAFEIPPDVGKALLSFGGISLAIAFNFQLDYGGYMGDFVLSATILAIFIFDEYTAISILNILRRQGEVT
jgi:hypothetical protein